MSLTNPISAKHMVKVSQDVFIAKKRSDALKNVWVYNNPDRAGAWETAEDVYANWKSKKIKNGDMMNVKIDLHEINPSILDIIENGVIRVENEVASVTDRTEEFKPWEWGYNKDVLLSSRNADKSVITPTEVKALINWAWVDLVLNTDYTVWVNMIWDTRVKFIKGWELDENAPSISSITVKYSATPDDTLQKIEHFESAMPTWFVMILEEKREYEGKEVWIRFKLENCQNVKAFHKPISDSDNTTSWYPCDITWKVVWHEYFWF